MNTIPSNCAGINTVGSFCDCISAVEYADPAAQAFCTRAKTDPRVTGEDLTELKMALMDMDDACCDC